ncbi:DUF948 domain-containing protein [Candidatus Pacearchaeota archaeon]|nr:DUF948 domain-containing protein [Candidatus Pacearchaeota archaeon]
MFKKENKKSQGLSINFIIIAAISLIVLIVLIAIFTGRIGKTAENLESCWLRGGKCSEDPCGDNYAEIKNTKECPPDGDKYCCVEVLT